MTISYDVNIDDGEKVALIRLEPALREALADSRITGNLRWVAKVDPIGRTVLVLETADSSQRMVSYYAEREITTARDYAAIRDDLRARHTYQEVLLRRMVGTGQIQGVAGVITFPGVEWLLILRRRDRNPDTRLADLIKEGVTARRIEWFLPHWQTFEWQSLSTELANLAATGEWQDVARVAAIDGEWEVELRGMRPEISEEHMHREWRILMGQTADTPYARQL